MRGCVCVHVQFRVKNYRETHTQWQPCRHLNAKRAPRSVGCKKPKKYFDWNKINCNKWVNWMMEEFISRFRSNRTEPHWALHYWCWCSAGGFVCSNICIYGRTISRICFVVWSQLPPCAGRRPDWRGQEEERRAAHHTQPPEKCGPIIFNCFLYIGGALLHFAQAFQIGIRQFFGFSAGSHSTLNPAIVITRPETIIHLQWITHTKD